MKKKLRLFVPLLGLALLLSSCSSGTKIDQTIHIKPVGNTLQYDLTAFTVKAGSRVKLIFENVATSPVMKHNVVILKTASAIQEVGQQAITAEGNIPNHPAIIAHTKTTNPQETSTVTFKAPKPGEYPYICTYPGHYMTMTGTMTSVK